MLFLFGLCSSLTILSSFIINVIKDDLVSPAVGTPIVIADFIDTGHLQKIMKIQIKLKTKTLERLFLIKLTI